MAPDDVLWQERANGRLAIGVSTLQFSGCGLSFMPDNIYHFWDAAHAADVVRATCHLPLVGGVMPYKIDRHAFGYYDGGLSMLVPDVEPITETGSNVISVTCDGRPLVEGIDIVPKLGFTVRFQTWVSFVVCYFNAHFMPTSRYKTVMPFYV